MTGPRRLVAAVALATTPTVGAAAHEYRTLAADATEDGRTIRYAIVLPDGYDPETEYPALLALPPGPQTEAMVEAGLTRYWGRQAAERGWIVVSPVAPEGTSFYRGAETAIPALLDEVTASHRVEHGLFHLAGASNGGRSAFRVATLYPDRFASITVLPGYPPTDEDRARLHRLTGRPVHLFVGGDDDDERWVDESRRAHAALLGFGIESTLRVIPGEGHVPPNLDGEVVMIHLEAVRNRLESRRRIAVVLDDFHDAASKGDGPRYFGHFAPHGVFLGTDPTERWTVAQFRAFAEPYFAVGSGWTYTARSRAIVIDGDAAWFDELLDNEKYGVCRGTGSLQRIDGSWRIAQYSLSLAIPNERALEVVELLGQ